MIQILVYKKDFFLNNNNYNNSNNTIESDSNKYTVIKILTILITMINVYIVITTYT